METQIISGEKLRRLQLAELEILKEIQRICVLHGLRLYLSSGTLLGAVRHGGFIPWDDDIDVCMPRSDYNRFRELVKTELSEAYFPLDFRDRDTNDTSIGSMLKIASRTFRVVRVRGDGTTKTVNPAWVDVFPLDGIPDGGLQRRWHLLWLQYHKRMVSCAIWKNVGVAPQKTGRRQRIAKVITGLHIPQLLNLDCKTRRFKLDRALQQCDFYQSRDCINMLGEYEWREIVPTALYGTPTPIRFEGFDTYGPKDPDGVLRILYGDYMQLPPQEEQICKHCVDIIELPEASSEAE